MHWQFTPYLLPLLLSAISSVALALFAWQHRQITGTISFVWLMLVVAEWSFGNVLELGSVDLASKLFWANAEYFGIAFTPVAWFIFAARYTGREKWLTRRTYALLSILPLLTILLVWTNDWHGLMRTDVRLDTNGPFSVIAKNYGGWFWIHTAYSYLLIFLGSFLLIQKMTWGSGIYRSQIAALLISVLAPWIGNLAYLSKLSPIPRLDLTPVSFAVSGLALAWAIFRSGLLDVVPVARDIIIENMNDGVIVFDMQDRVVDINLAAQQMLRRSAPEAIGQTAARIFSARLDLVEHYRRTSQIHQEIVAGEGEAQRVFEVRASPLIDQRHQPMGHLVTLREITDRKQAEQARRERELLARLRNVLTNSPDTVFVLDLAARKVTFLNREEFCGYTKNELEAPRSILHVLHPEDVPALKGSWRQISKAKVDKIDPIECRIRRKDGAWEWIQARATILERNLDGTPKQILFTLTVVTERKQIEEKLKYLSTHDALTGLYNRAFFEEEMARIARGRQFPVSIVMADVDELKRINDNLGHAAGDESLRRAAQALSAAFRAEDVVARIGGDEFAVLLLRTDAAAAEIALSRIRSHIARLNTLHAENPIYLSMGAGTTEQGDSLPDAFKEADTRMYADKSSGRRHPL